MLVVWLLQPVVFKWRQNSPSTDFASKQSRHLNALYRFGPCHACKQKVWHIFSYKLDILHNLSTFPSQLVKKQAEVLPHSPVTTGAFGGLSPSETKLQSPHPNWNMKHSKTAMFVKISECQAPLHKCTVKLPYRDFLVTVLLPHQVFHWPFFWQQWLDVNTISEFIFKLYLLILPIVAL